MVAPVFEVVPAAILVIAAWAAEGLVNPGMVNLMGCPPENVPAVNDTVKTNGHDPLRAAVPAAPAAGVVKWTATVPEFARAMPEKPLSPCIVMMILPLLGTVDTGASVTVMVTDAAPRATLLRVMVGELSPRSPMEGYVPVMLDPTMV